MVDRQRGRSNDPIIGEITIELKKAQLIFIRHAKNFPSSENPTTHKNFKEFHDLLWHW